MHSKHDFDLLKLGQFNVRPYIQSTVNSSRAIKEALTASLLAMDKDGVTVAIVPGLSTGVYAPSLEIGRQLRADYLRLVEEAVDGVELRHIQRVIYCNKAAA